jgi:predicted Zn-dependent protease
MATLGGHVVVFRGLIEELDDEEMLAAVLAHEIGHVRERHVISAMGRGVALVATLNAIGINSRGLSRWAVGQGGQMAALTYSREAEREADRAAVEAAARLYGHAGGVVRLFEFFGSRADGGLEILKTHPLPATRLAEIRSLAQARGVPTEGAPHALTPALAALAADAAPPQTP